MQWNKKKKKKQDKEFFYRTQKERKRERSFLSTEILFICMKTENVLSTKGCFTNGVTYFYQQIQKWKKKKMSDFRQLTFIKNIVW